MNEPLVPTSLANRPFKRIVIIKPSSLGDVIHGLPVLRALRRRFPDAHLAWIVAKPYADLLRQQRDLDEAIEFDRRRYGSLGRRLAPSLEFVEFLRAMWNRKFDLAIDLQGLFRSGVLTAATGASVRIGFSRAREMASVFYTHKVTVPYDDLHAIDKNMLVARALGCDPTVTVSIDIDPQTLDQSDQRLAQDGIANAPFLAVLPGARWETKLWPTDRFAETIDLVRRRFDLPAVLLGGPDDKPRCDAVAGAATSDPANLAGQTSIPQLAAVLQRSAAVLAHDSAPMHIAAALQKPLVAIFGPTSPSKTGPYNADKAVIQAAIPCAPCYIRKVAACPHRLQCMTDVHPRQIVELLARRMTETAPT